MKAIRFMIAFTSLLALLLLISCGKEESTQTTGVESGKATVSELTNE